MRFGTALAILLSSCSEGMLGPGGDPGIDPALDSGAAPECSGDVDCAFGETCVGGVCTTNTATVSDIGCNSDADCPAGFACAESTGQCVEDPLFPPPPSPGSDCVTGSTRVCGTKVGRCEYGTEICMNGVFGSCEGGVDPIDELCNGIDDDCDGEDDDGFAVGAACSAGVGACQEMGATVCAADGTIVCSATGLDPAGRVELCGNNIDDDCDGVQNNGFPNLGMACTAGMGTCASNGTYVCSADRMSTVCNAAPRAGSGEICNNLDDDCDGTTDDGCDDDGDDYCDIMLMISGTPSVCPNTTDARTRDCNDADPAINPGEAEICNDQRDQNCDGNNNDGCAPCNAAIDADLDGSNQCLDCDETNGAVRPGATEACDGIDNDCDSQIDEPFDSDRDTYTTCGTVPGGGLDSSYIDCADNNANRHPFACELCALSSADNTVACGATNDRGNNVDEDCDGYLDETCSPCSNADTDNDGYSECEGDCAPSNDAVSPGRAEQCDGLDTDCNVTTTENCGVSDTCHWPGTPAPDACRADLLCVESLGNGGNPTGVYTCTSFCNFSLLGLGLGDGCESNQACLSSLTPTANLHGCTVSTDIGTSAVGTNCNSDDDCRSSVCLRDQRAAGPAQEYCSDLCGSDDYCAGNTTCQAWGTVARCYRELSVQDRAIGAACNDTPVRCEGGPNTCITISAGNRICSEVCCENADCPSGYFCSVDGPGAAGPNGGYDSVPVCWPNGSGTHTRVAGQACTSNGQCKSEFCDRTLRVCVDFCCNDSSCPAGLSCESARVTRRDDNQLFGRACVNLTPASPLEAL